ncbi:MAG: bile acid:sodium symporter [Desulfobacterales bacterium]
MIEWFKRHWFVIGLGLVFAATVWDFTGAVSRLGVNVKSRHGPDAAIILIFFFSGLMLNADQIRSGATDIKGLAPALALIFVITPLWAAVIGVLPVSTEIKIGIFLVASMPTTLSSGVVMTGASGGNIAHALLITISANSLSIVTIPLVLSGLLDTLGNPAEVAFEKLPIMIKIGLFVLVPLGVGIIFRRFIDSFFSRISPRLNKLNQIFVLGIVWMSLSESREAIIENHHMVGETLVVVIIFHLLALISAFLMVGGLKIGPGRRESIVFMGVQKTLPLSVILQVALFPGYGMVLVVCVLHHVTHLMIDGFLIGWFRKSGDSGRTIASESGQMDDDS